MMTVVVDEFTTTAGLQVVVVEVVVVVVVKGVGVGGGRGVGQTESENSPSQMQANRTHATVRDMSRLEQRQRLVLLGHRLDLAFGF